MDDDWAFLLGDDDRVRLVHGRALTDVTSALGDPVARMADAIEHTEKVLDRSQHGIAGLPVDDTDARKAAAELTRD